MLLAFAYKVFFSCYLLFSLLFFKLETMRFLVIALFLQCFGVYCFRIDFFTVLIITGTLVIFCQTQKIFDSKFLIYQFVLFLKLWLFGLVLKYCSIVRNRFCFKVS